VSQFSIHYIVAFYTCGCCLTRSSRIYGAEDSSSILGIGSFHIGVHTRVLRGNGLVNGHTIRSAAKLSAVTLAGHGAASHRGKGATIEDVIATEALAGVYEDYQCGNKKQVGRYIPSIPAYLKPLLAQVDVQASGVMASVLLGIRSRLERVRPSRLSV
jgi:hypothetical protein